MTQPSTKVFVHGNPEVDAIWGPLVDALAERGVDDVVLLSPPGFGAPTPDGWDASMRSYVEWLAGEVEQLDSPIDIVGHDWGAGHVYGLLADRPGLVRSYAADVAGLLHPDYVWHDAAQAWQTPELGEQVIDGMVSASIDDKTALFVGMGISDEIASALAAGVDAEMGRCILALYRDAAQPAVSAAAQRLFDAPRPPGLIIDPTADPYVSSELGRDVAVRLGAEVLRLEDRGHWWMVEDPGAAADGLAAFWSGL
jgi:pimeloyl-ACP methyl ester carboxylesterase